MAGKVCPQCGRPTFFKTGLRGKCTKCNFSMTIPPNEGKWGKGQKCLNCGRMTVFNGNCSNCGAQYK